MVKYKLQIQAVTQHLHTNIRGLPAWHTSGSQQQVTSNVADYRESDVLNMRIIMEVYSINRFLNIE
jgi:hypothetical protein